MRGWKSLSCLEQRITLWPYGTSSRLYVHYLNGKHLSSIDQGLFSLITLSWHCTVLCNNPKGQRLINLNHKCSVPMTEITSQSADNGWWTYRTSPELSLHTWQLNASMMSELRDASDDRSTGAECSKETRFQSGISILIQKSIKKKKIKKL